MNNLKVIRKQLKLTQAELAKLIGCTQGNIGHYENKNQTIKPEVAQRIVSVARERGLNIAYEDIYVEARMSQRTQEQMEVTNMTITTTTSRAAMVDKDYHWIDAKVTPPPRGPKMLLIDKRLGVAVLGAWRDSDGWTHWCPLPTFKQEPT